jgi:membrane fusion protein, heavy metal efflux system
MVEILALEGKIMEIGKPGRIMRRRTASSVSLVFIAGLVGCSTKPATTATKAEPPAKVTAVKLPGEADLISVTLKPEAETRLGILTASVEMKPVPRTMSRAGDVIVPPGRSSIVSAPQTGTLTAAEVGIVPVPGLAVKKGQAIFTLLPILSAERAVLSPLEMLNLKNMKSTAEGQYKNAKSAFDLAKANVDELEKLRAGDVSKVQMLTARATYDQAKASLEATETQLANYSQVLGASSEEAGKLAPLPLRAPADGVLINVPVQVGQQVPVGSVLFEVANLDPVYIKVPVFVGEDKMIARDRDAAIGGIADAPGMPTKVARTVKTTPSANALTTTIDLYYEVENHDGNLVPNQRVGVTLPLKGEAESKVVPYAAILYDLNGGAWVYEAMGKHVFARRRVIVDHVMGTEAVLAMGPKPGTKVVTDGAAELFGTEFGGSK